MSPITIAGSLILKTLGSFSANKMVGTDYIDKFLYEFFDPLSWYFLILWEQLFEKTEVELFELF